MKTRDFNQKATVIYKAQRDFVKYEVNEGSRNGLGVIFVRWVNPYYGFTNIYHDKALVDVIAYCGDSSLATTPVNTQSSTVPTFSRCRP